MLAHSEFRHGITINNILPGIIEKMPFSDALSAVGLESSERCSDLATPATAAEVITEPCGEKFRFVTGSEIAIPGNLFSRIRKRPSSSSTGTA
ncbi:MAG: hypothetical protein ACRECF_00380 [Methyloceanibacter sp.]